MDGDPFAQVQAPQFVEFDKLDDQNADSWFESHMDDASAPVANVMGVPTLPPSPPAAVAPTQNLVQAQVAAAVTAHPGTPIHAADVVTTASMTSSPSNTASPPQFALVHSLQQSRSLASPLPSLALSQEPRSPVPLSETATAEDAELFEVMCAAPGLSASQVVEIDDEISLSASALQSLLQSSSHSTSAALQSSLRSSLRPSSSPPPHPQPSSPSPSPSPSPAQVQAQVQAQTLMQSPSPALQSSLQSSLRSAPIRVPKQEPSPSRSPPPSSTATAKTGPKTQAGKMRRFLQPTASWKARTTTTSTTSAGRQRRKKKMVTTVPKTPAFMKRKAAITKPRAKTSEELELEAMERARKELKHRLARNRKRAHGRSRPKTAPSTHRTMSSKPLTEPVEFTFRTDARIKKNTPAAPGAGAPQAKKRPKTSAGPRKVTEPVPFHFASAKGPKTHTAKSEAFVSQAQLINAFSTKTPLRFKSKPTPLRTSSKPPQLTMPQTPKFATDAKAKSRPKAKSSEELILEEMKSHGNFKARPLNRRIFESHGEMGVPKVAKAAPTRAVSPQFASGPRVRATEENDDLVPEEETFVFKARPVPASVYKPGPVSKVKPHLRPLTVPHSPALSTKKRAQAHKHGAGSPESGAQAFKAGLMPVFDTPELPPRAKLTTTVPVPFQLESDKRGAAAQARLEAIRAEEEAAAKAAAQFKANPMYDLTTPDPLPRAAPRELTVPVPFQLQSVTRHERAVSEFEARVAAEREEEEAMFSSFAAQPIVVGPVFTPSRSKKPLTEIKAFDLNTSRRAEERVEKDAAKAEQAAELEKERARMEAEAAREEAELLREYRKSLDFKAKPIRHFAPAPVAKFSTRPLTEPVSPKFATARRARMRA